MSFLITHKNENIKIIQTISHNKNEGTYEYKSQFAWKYLIPIALDQQTTILIQYNWN